MRHPSVLLVLGLILLPRPALAVTPVVAPLAIGETFCLARTLGDMSLVEPYLSDDLAHAIEKAVAQNEFIQRQAPDEKPPLGDGVPWQSYPDVAPECVVDHTGADQSQVTITYNFPEAPDANWSDTLLLEQVGGEWKISDVVYKDGGRLTATLASAFED